MKIFQITCREITKNFTCKLVSWQRVFCVKNQQSCRSTFTRPMVSFFEIPRLFLYNLLHGCPLDFVLQESPTSPSCPIISCLLFVNENKLFNLCSCKYSQDHDIKKTLPGYFRLSRCSSTRSQIFARESSDFQE